MPAIRTLEVNFFSVTNANQFLNGAKPNLQEMETVVFNEIRQRVNCSANVADMSINFGQNRYWSHKSGDLTQRVNAANIPFQRVGHALCNEAVGGVCTPATQLYQQGEGYIKEGVSINELLINGVDTTQYKNVIAANPKIKGDLPELERDNFAILSQLHYPKRLTLNSDSDSYGKIMLMDEQNEMLWWKTESSLPICSQFPGTTGEYYDKVTEQSVLHYYSDDLCAAAVLKYDSVDNSHGFPALKFVAYPESIGGSCYATSANLPYGAVDVKGCQRGLPFVMSNPHFHDSDSSYGAALEGMKTDPTKYQTYFIIEPVTGMLVEYSQKYQLNVNLQKFKQNDNLNAAAMSDTILPVYWFDKKYMLDATHIEAIKSMLSGSSQTTTTIISPVNEGDPASSEQLRTVEEKLSSISYQLTVVSGAVFTFIVLIVIILAGFSLIQFRHNKKLIRGRADSLPQYVENPFPTKP
jgi:hypothetical protein